jgi:hypothetical protein
MDTGLRIPFMDRVLDRLGGAAKLETGATETGGQPLTERRYPVGYVHPTSCRTDGQNVHGTQRSK